MIPFINISNFFKWKKNLHYDISWGGGYGPLTSNLPSAWAPVFEYPNDGRWNCGQWSVPGLTSSRDLAQHKFQLRHYTTFYTLHNSSCYDCCITIYGIWIVYEFAWNLSHVGILHVDSAYYPTWATYGLMTHCNLPSPSSSPHAHRYTLNFVISTSLMSLLLWYLKTVGNGCSE